MFHVKQLQTGIEAMTLYHMAPRTRLVHAPLIVVSEQSFLLQSVATATAGNYHHMRYARLDISPAVIPDLAMTEYNIY